MTAFKYAKDQLITVSHEALQGAKGVVHHAYTSSVYGQSIKNVYTVKLADGKMIDFDEDEIECSK